jgi:hypothetical protein
MDENPTLTPRPLKGSAIRIRHLAFGKEINNIKSESKKKQKN